MTHQPFLVVFLLLLRTPAARPPPPGKQKSCAGGSFAERRATPSARLTSPPASQSRFELAMARRTTAYVNLPTLQLELLKPSSPRPLARTPACTKYTTISREPGRRVVGVMGKSPNAKRQRKNLFFKEPCLYLESAAPASQPAPPPQFAVTLTTCHLKSYAYFTSVVVAC